MSVLRPHARVLRLAVLFASFSTALIAACGSDDDTSAPPSLVDGGSIDAPVTSNDAAGHDSGAASDAADAKADDASSNADTGAPFVVVPQLRLGFHTACALDADGTAKCWGGGRPSPAPLAAGTHFRAVEVGSAASRACAIRDDGALLCWQPDTFDPKVKDAPELVSISIGDDHACAIAKSGQLLCWGKNPHGQLGTGDTTPTETPTVVGSDTDWKTVRAGRDHTCAIKTSGALYCWGGNGSNELGDGAGGFDAGPIQSSVPVAVAPGSTWIDVAVGLHATCGVRSDGALLCWGTAIGTGVLYSTTPKEIDAARDWKHVAMEYQHACASKTTGTVHCWGDSTFGENGDGTLDDRALPVQIGSDTDWTDVDVGVFTSCGRKVDGSIRCWGWNGTAGMLGNGTGAHLTPKRIAPGELFKDVSVAYNRNACAVKKTGESIVCWGRKIGQNANAQVPEVVPTPTTTWDSVTLGTAHACARQTNDAVHCWGLNNAGQAGVPSGGTIVAAPTSVALNAQAVVAGFDHTCAISAGKLYCWGYNDSGRTVPGNVATEITSPTKVGDDDWLDVSVAQDSMCVIRADHSLWCFGQGWTAPMQQADDSTSWTKGAGGGGNVHFALKDDVLNLVATFQPPTPYAGTSYVSASSCGGFYCGIRADGTLWCSGLNESGELGDGTTANRNSAVQVGTSTDWTKVATSSTHTCGLRNGGELYCWGSNDGGEIGDGTSWSTTPVAVGP